MRIYRFGFATVSLAAVITQFLQAAQKPGFNPLNFFSFFTNLSNIFGALVLMSCALSVPFARSRSGELARGAAAVYLAVTFVVYWLLLNDLTESLGIVIPWVNLVVHTVMPLAMVGDWVIDPPSRRLTWRSTAWWFAFPLIYFVYSLLRGALAGWYPYPFLNPALVGGYGGVAIYFAAIALGFGVAILAIGAVARRRAA